MEEVRNVYSKVLLEYLKRRPNFWGAQVVYVKTNLKGMGRIIPVSIEISDWLL
jgi:hypothetical protein